MNHPTPQIIQTEADYEEALRLIDALLQTDPDPDPASSSGMELERLSVLVEHYEEEHYPIDPPTLVEAILFRMDQQGLNEEDLIPFIGSAVKVSEVLSNQRGLTPEMIHNLEKGLGFPADALTALPGSPSGLKTEAGKPGRLPPIQSEGEN